MELTPYNGLPHLITPVIVDTEPAVRALKGIMGEMFRRNRRLEELGVRNIEGYHRHRNALEPMPHIVVAVDELADLMMAASYEVEQTITRLAQLGRATGIHLIVATQRPSVDVVTGLIKANFPSRIGFAVVSQVDSRTILDAAGAERLLGRGDMLFLSGDTPKPLRVQGAYVSDGEIENLIDFWKSQSGPPLPEFNLEPEGFGLGEEIHRLYDDIHAFNQEEWDYGHETSWAAEWKLKNPDPLPSQRERGTANLNPVAHLVAAVYAMACWNWLANADHYASSEDMEVICMIMTIPLFGIYQFFSYGHEME